MIHFSVVHVGRCLPLFTSVLLYMSLMFLSLCYCIEGQLCPYNSVSNGMTRHLVLKLLLLHGFVKYTSMFVMTYRKMLTLCVPGDAHIWRISDWYVIGKL